MNPRDVNHPSIRTIIAALDRAAASPHADSDDLVQLTAGSILEHGNGAEYFIIPNKWQADHARAALLAVATLAPDEDLHWMAEAAKSKIEWLEWWDERGEAEARGVM